MFRVLLILLICTPIIFISTHNVIASEAESFTLPTSVHAEILLYEGVQTFHVMMESPKYLIAGEIDLGRMKSALNPMHMLKIRTKRGMNGRGLILKTRIYQKYPGNSFYFDFNLRDKENKKITECSVQTELREDKLRDKTDPLRVMMWIKQEPTCIDDMEELTFENDNEE
ncbi:MAG: hypothetical protein HOO06_03440 [Bdellovibrionaceae bacterium]|jgi:hypothetical protein|nr:hypothetical protein [Pseudobdellovibrionaceae bacterium]